MRHQSRFTQTTMNIYRIIVFIAVMLGGILPSVATDVEAPEIVLGPDENKQDDDKVRPRMPAYSPVYCQVGADYVIFFCRHEATGEISVTDADGAVIATAVAELSAGFTVMLPGGVTPGMTLRVTIGEVTYSATI